MRGWRSGRAEDEGRRRKKKEEGTEDGANGSYRVATFAHALTKVFLPFPLS